MTEPRERFAHYDRTQIEIRLPDGSTAVVQPGRPTPPGLHSLLPLTVITAWNPGAERPGESANAAAHESLIARLTLLRDAGHEIDVLPAVGRAIDGEHYEESVAVHGLSKDQATALGREFGQDAIFAIDAAGATVMPCD